MEEEEANAEQDENHKQAVWRREHADQLRVDRCVSCVPVCVSIYRMCSYLPVCSHLPGEYTSAFFCVGTCSLPISLVSALGHVGARYLAFTCICAHLSARVRLHS